MQLETITWHPLPAGGLPDASTTVLMETIDAQQLFGGEVWPGYWTGETWVDAASGMPVAAERVVAWAHMPAGSRQC